MILRNPKSLLAVFIVISIVLLAVIIAGVYQIKDKNEETSRLLSKITQETEDQALTQSIKAIKNDAAQDLALLDDIVFSEDKVVPLIESIEETGQVFNLKTEILSVLKIDGNSSAEPNVVRMTIESSGSWSSLLSFLNAIESMPGRVMIEESTLSKTEAGWGLRVVLALHSFD
jgi:uncharacterized protein (UPF0333 family)